MNQYYYKQIFRFNNIYNIVKSQKIILMFRTKSLTNKEMKNLIQKNRPSLTHKQNRNFSLRSLIADKTLQYHKHMERLVQETNQIIYSNKKSNKKRTPKNMLDDVSNSQLIQKTINQFNSQCQQNQNMDKGGQIQQFEPEVVQYVQVQSMPTYQGSQMITQQNQSFSVFEGSANRTAFKINLQNQQLNDENKQLRRQIEHLQQRLQTAQLIKIQKQSQSQSYKLKLKILQLQIMKYQQKQEQRTKYFNKFTTTNPKNIRIVRKLTQDIQIQTQSSTMVEYQCQTNQTIQDITTLYKLCQQQTKSINVFEHRIQQLGNLFNPLQKQPDQISSPIQQQKQDKKQTIIGKISHAIICQQSQNQFYKKSLAEITQQYQQLSGEHTSLITTHSQLQTKSDKKIKTLIQLLNLAQKQIKILLNKLRQNKNNTVTNYKQMISNVYKIYQESNDQQKKQIMNNILYKANQSITEKQ